MSQGNGLCREAFERASHSPEVRNRIFQAVYGGAFAAQRINGDKNYCGAQCF